MPLHHQDHPHRLQPNSRNCFGCGVDNPAGLALRVFTVRPGEVRATHTLDERFEGFPGIAHGGIVAVMLDEMVARCVLTEDDTGFMVTAKLDLRYRTPVPIGVELTLTGKLLGRKRQLVTAHAELLLPDGTLAAEADATLSAYPEMSEDSERLQELGWKVYPSNVDQG